MRKLTKLFTNDTIKSIDEKARTAEYIISTDDVDRMGEIVEQSWDLENYKKNPVVLWGHDPSQPDNILGKAIEIETYKDGDRTMTKAVVQFADEGTSKGVDTVWKLITQGILKTVSVGFIPHTFKTAGENKDTDVLADNELLEFSLVGIPANPNAVALAYGDGSITEKDAKWLMTQYKKETEYLQKSLYDTMKAKNENGTDTSKEKAMSDEDIKKLAEALGTAVSDAITPKLDEILKAVTDEEASDNEDDGADNGNGDANGDTGAGDGTGTQDEPKKSAKSEQGDDDGAFDENEEKTEEAEKEFLAQLEKDYAESEKGE